MNEPSTVLVSAKGIPPMHIVSIVILVGVVPYYMLLAVNSLGLANQKGSATVSGKGYRKGGQTYYTQYIDGRPLPVPQTIPETYLLKLDIGGRETECAVVHSLCEEVGIQDVAQVTYQRRRLTSALQVVTVNR